MNMKSARNMMKNKQARPTYAPLQPVINEQEEEQESDSDMPQIASNTTFKESFDEDDKYSQYHKMVEKTKIKPLRVSKDSFSSDKSNGGEVSSGRASVSMGGGLVPGGEDRRPA